MKYILISVFLFFLQISIAQDFKYELKILTAFEKFIYEKESSKFSKDKVNSMIKITQNDSSLFDKINFDYKIKCSNHKSDDTMRVSVKRTNKKIYSRKSKTILEITNAVKCGDFYFMKINIFNPLKNEGVFFIMKLDSLGDKLDYKKYNYVF